MNITPIKIKVSELTEGYENDRESADGGVYAYGGKLIVRPKFQRSFVYTHDKAQAVIDTALKGFPLNNFYIVDNGDGTYDCLDGQQRTISLCDFVNGDMPVSLPWLFDGREFYLRNLQRAYPEIAERFMNYEIEVKLIQGEKSEQLEWFKTINIAGETLTPQELRNANYVSEWLTDAKRYFSKATPNASCPAEQVGKAYTNANANRQELLEQVLCWKIDTDDEGVLCSYMADSTKEQNAFELWDYYTRVITWVKKLFPEADKSMKTVEWGYLYNHHKDDNIDIDELNEELATLIEGKANKEITSSMAKIYEYLITRDESLLKVRKFDEVMRRALYNRQKGICPDCGEEFDMEDMHAHHIISWAAGGLTQLDNGVMLCEECHRNRHLTDEE